MQFFATLENSGFGSWVRESSSIWAYPTILFMHTVGLGFLVGLNVVIDLRVLGFAPRVPLAPMQKFYVVMWVAFWINAASGTALLIADATTKMTNPVFYVKLAFIALAVVTMAWLRRRVFRDDPRGDVGESSQSGPGREAASRRIAIASLIFWAGAITAGRLMAYVGPVSGAPGLQNRIP